ncbi:hypothetical protein [Kitasatospora sp. NPDC017646]|uniref:hypothetical protein n=1 Tax=Kitasatospora sp. NPDC017646 TaxID=3364024 RepID=UPI0037AA51C5
MNEATRLPNHGTGLTGPNYARHSRVEPTVDVLGKARWIATDESGWGGDQLAANPDRYMTIGSVAIDDQTAQQVLLDLRRDARIADQVAEVKFKHFKDRPTGRQALVKALGPGGSLEGRASVYVIDKHYFVVGKIIDLLIETQAHSRGVEMYRNGAARQSARTLFEEGPRALGGDGFKELVEATVDFASMRNRDGQQSSVEDFFDVLEAAWAKSTRRRVTTVLAQARGTRAEAADFLQALQEGDLSDNLEPLIPGVAAVVNNWSERIGRVNALTDDQKMLTDDWLDKMMRQFDGDGSWDLRWVLGRAQVGQVLRGESKTHPSLQLADLVAGAGFAVAKRFGGSDSPAAAELYPAVVPLIDPNSLVAFDDMSRFAKPLD